MPGALFEATGFQKGADFENKRMYNIEGAVLLVLIPSERYPFAFSQNSKKAQPVESNERIRFHLKMGWN